MSAFPDRLDEAVRRVGHPCLLGLDPHLDLLPEEFAEARDASASRKTRARAVGRFCKELIDVAAGRVAAVKPQAAFFEVFGADGMAAWEEVVAYAHERGLLVVGDVKRGDVPSTAAAYARAYLEGVPGGDPDVLCDAITVNAFLGSDAMEPFLAACEHTGKGLYVLVRTSNPGSAELQLHGSPPLVDLLAEAVDRWGASTVGECGFSAVGAVVGATHPEELERLRGRMPRTPLLLPGYGAQGAGAAGLGPAFPDPEHPLRGALINSSRGIAFAWRAPEQRDRTWREASGLALEAMIEDVRTGLGLTTPGAAAQ